MVSLHHPEWIRHSGPISLGKLQEAKLRIKKRVYILKSLLIDAENDLAEIEERIQFQNNVPTERELEITNDYLIGKTDLDREFWDVKKISKSGYRKIIEGLLEL